MKRKLLVIAIILVGSHTIMADAVNDLFTEYKQKGVSNSSEQAGEKLWHKKYVDKKTGQIRSCTTCHTTNLKNAGKHKRTGKVIRPMASSINKERLTDVKKIKKWFKRNCKWTVGRECSAQEKADILAYLKTQ